MPRILVVEDDEPLRKILVRLLSRPGCEVVEAENGHAAVQSMCRHAADLVITDLIMPEMDGIETIRSLARDFPATKIIAISGGGRIAGDQYLDIASKLGVQKILAKPFSPWELLHAVDELLA